MTPDDDTPEETSEQLDDRGAALEVAPGGKADARADFVIDKTKKPSVFQLREVTIPPAAAAERAERLARGDVPATSSQSGTADPTAALASDTERDLAPPVAGASPPSPPAAVDDGTELRAATPPSHGGRRTLWTVLAVALGVVAVSLVVMASGGPMGVRSPSEASAAPRATPASLTSSTSAPRSATPSTAASLETPGASPPELAGPAPQKPLKPAPKSTPTPGTTPKPSADSPTLPPGGGPSPAAPPRAFTTQRPF